MHRGFAEPQSELTGQCIGGLLCLKLKNSVNKHCLIGVVMVVGEVASRRITTRSDDSTIVQGQDAQSVAADSAGSVAADSAGSVAADSAGSVAADSGVSFTADNAGSVAADSTRCLDTAVLEQADSGVNSQPASEHASAPSRMF